MFTLSFSAHFSDILFFFIFCLKSLYCFIVAKILWVLFETGNFNYASLVHFVTCDNADYFPLFWLLNFVFFHCCMLVIFLCRENSIWSKCEQCFFSLILFH